MDFYFDKINHIRYAIDQRLFRRGECDRIDTHDHGLTTAYDAVHASQSDVSLTSLLALPLIFAVLATAMQVAPLDWIGSEETRRKRSLKLVWSSTFGLQMSNALNAESLQLVEARIVVSDWSLAKNIQTEASKACMRTPVVKSAALVFGRACISLSSSQIRTS